jgi:hypothetical protein
MMGIVFDAFRLIPFDIYPHPSQNRTPESRRWFPGICLIAWRGPSRLQSRTVPLLPEFPIIFFSGSQSDVPTKAFPIISSGLGYESKRIPCASLPALCLSNLCYYEPLMPGGGSTLAGGLRWGVTAPEGLGGATAYMSSAYLARATTNAFHFLWLDIPLTLTTRSVTSLSCSTLKHASSITR